MQPDKKAIKILFDTFWTPQGWRQDRLVASEDFAYAKSKNVMFDDSSYTHDEAIQTAISYREKTYNSRVADAFISSLSNRRLDLRSALGSFAVIQHLKKHDFTGNQDGLCSICGIYSGKHRLDKNVYNFERFKWGGVRHLNPAFAGVDLALFSQCEFETPSSNDYAILGDLLDIAASMPKNAKLADLDKCLAKVFPSNSAERRTLMAILGYCGILIDPLRGSFRNEFIEYGGRDQSSGKNDWPFPVLWWRGHFGVDFSAVQDWFPLVKLRQTKLLN
jgi:hypothetical protein